VLTIQNADLLTLCEERRVFREAKVGHRRGTGVDEVRRGSFPGNSIKGNHTPSKRGKRTQYQGIVGRFRPLGDALLPAHSTPRPIRIVGGILEKQADVGHGGLGTPTDIFFALEEKVYPVCDAKSDTT
jgi:hypothetical protein